MQIIENRGFEVVSYDDSLVLFEGYGASGSINFSNKKNAPHFKFYFNKDYTVDLGGDWESERLRFIMTNKFSKIREGLFKIYYEPPGVYECVSNITTNIFKEDLYPELLDYLFCIAIEGYAVLNCETFYKKTAMRSSMAKNFEKNIASLTSWNSPGKIAKQYA